MTWQEELDALFDDCAGTFLDSAGAAVTISKGGVSKPCILSGMIESREMRDTGYMPELAPRCEMLRTDFTTLAIADRSQVTVAGHALVVKAIENDPADACVTLTLWTPE